MFQTGSRDLSKHETPVERIYREMSTPSSAPPVPNVPTTAPAMHLDASDVSAILQHKRSASLDELNYIIEHAKTFCLSSWQRNQISVQLTIAIVNRARPASTPVDQLFSALGIVETPVGLLHDRSWVQRELRAGTQAIASCRAHRVPRCSCWREARERLWRIQDHFGSGTPETWATVQLWEVFEELENASRPERAAASQPVSQGMETFK